MSKYLYCFILGVLFATGCIQDSPEARMNRIQQFRDMEALKAGNYQNRQEVPLEAQMQMNQDMMNNMNNTYNDNVIIAR